MVGLAAAEIHQSQHEHQDAHAAQPVREAPPEQHTLVQGFHLGQDAGAGGGEAGDHFKHRVQIAGNLPRKGEGRRADEGDEDPGQGRQDEALPGVHGPLRRLPPGQDKADQSRRSQGYQEIDAGDFPVDSRHDQRQQHKRGLDQKDDAGEIDNDGIIHGPSPVQCRAAKMSLRLRRPLWVVTTMTLSPTSMVSLPRGVMVLPFLEIQPMSRLSFRCRSCSGTPQ